MLAQQDAVAHREKQEIENVENDLRRNLPTSPGYIPKKSEELLEVREKAQLLKAPRPPRAGSRSNAQRINDGRTAYVV